MISFRTNKVAMRIEKTEQSRYLGNKIIEVKQASGPCLYSKHSWTFRIYYYISSKQDWCHFFWHIGKDAWRN